MDILLFRWATFRRKVALPQGNFDPVFGWQSDSKPFSNTNCQPNTRASRLLPTRPFGERSPT
ncbi:MAG: hypothetical protein LBI18_11725 [Planctomycetaceae bacterium]|nr:hypothetical protein [Planctomycetaceae bacterium]